MPDLLVQASTDTWGGFHYAWRDPDGLVTPEVVPPKDLNVETASAAELAEYGIARTSSLYDFFDRRGAGGAVAGTPCHGQTETAAPSNSYNWSGEIDQGGAAYEAVQSLFTMPTNVAQVNNCGGPGVAGDTTWVGLGGSNTGKLLQNGYDSYPATGGAPFAWYEGLGGVNTNGGSEPVSLPASAGNLVFVQTSYNRSAQTVTFLWSNQTTNKYLYSPAMPGLSSDYDSSSAEYIDERPAHGVNGSFFNFVSHDTVGFSGVQAEDSGNTYHLGSTVPSLDVTMVGDTSARTLGVTSGWTSQGAFNTTSTNCY